MHRLINRVNTLKKLFLSNGVVMDVVELGVSKRWAELVSQAKASLSQHEFAEKLGVSQSTVNGWEGAKRIPTLENVEKLARLMNRTPEEIVAYLYGRKISTGRPVQEQVLQMTCQEISEVSLAIARRLSQEKT
jgi:transcriptional regulator with XRE-family HTH domain